MRRRDGRRSSAQGATLEDVDAAAPYLRDAQMRLLDGVIAFLRITDVELE